MSSTSPDAVPGIDPRIRARRIEVARGAGRKRLKRATVLGAVLAVVLVIVGISQSPLLDVDRVEVAGAEHTTVDAVRAAAGIARGDQLLGLDLGRAERRVTALPWVASATVTRSLGGDVAIAVTERAPAVAIAQVSGVALVDADGRVLDLAPVTPPGLLTIDGLEGELAPGATVPEDGRGPLTVARRFAAALPDRATAVVVGDELTVSLHGGAVVRLGDASHLDAKLLAVTTVLQDVAADCMATLDVRLPGNPVLTREQRCR